METAETSSTRPFSRFWQIKRPKRSFIKPGCGDASRSCRQSREEQPGRRLPRRQAEGRTVVFPNRSQGLPGAGWPGRPRPTLPHTPRHPNRGVHSQPCKEQQGPAHTSPHHHREHGLHFCCSKKQKEKGSMSKHNRAGAEHVDKPCPAHTPAELRSPASWGNSNHSQTETQTGRPTAVRGQRGRAPWAREPPRHLRAARGAQPTSPSTRNPADSPGSDCS